MVNRCLELTNTVMNKIESLYFVNYLIVRTKGEPYKDNNTTVKI